METANPTFLLISSASAAALLSAVFSYAKTASERKAKVLELENEKLEKLRETITCFIANVDLYFEHAAQEFENAEEIEVTDNYDKIPGINIRYYKKTYLIDKELLNNLWKSCNALRVRLATFGSNEALLEISNTMKIVRKFKDGEPFIRKDVPPISFSKFEGNLIQKIIYFLTYPTSKVISGSNVKLLKIEWEENCEQLLKSLKSTFQIVENRIEKNSNTPDKLEKASNICVKIFIFILFAELIVYFFDYVPKLISSIGSFISFFYQLF
jgi:hypothetical protein